MLPLCMGDVQAVRWLSSNQERPIPFVRV